jgi:hypothetical protein
MASCFGRKKSGLCNGVIHQCKRCESVGCDQIEAGECSNQAFHLDRCLKCSKSRFLTAVELVTSLEAAWKGETIN